MAISSSMGCSGYKVADAKELHVRKPGFLFKCEWETYEDVYEPQHKPVEPHPASRRIIED